MSPWLTPTPPPRWPVLPLLRAGRSAAGTRVRASAVLGLRLGRGGGLWSWAAGLCQTHGSVDRLHCTRSFPRRVLAGNTPAPPGSAPGWVSPGLPPAPGSSKGAESPASTLRAGRAGGSPGRGGWQPGAEVGVAGTFTLIQRGWGSGLKTAQGSPPSTGAGGGGCTAGPRPLHPPPSRPWATPRAQPAARGAEDS